MISQFRLISCSLSPNTTKSDFKIAMRYLLFPRYWGRWYNGGNPELLKDLLQKTFGWPYIFFWNSARGALFFLLKALDLQDGDEVLTQAFSCTVVPNAIIAAQGHPVYVDIDERTFNMNLQDLRDKITPKTKVMIVQHTFGIPAHIVEVQEICRERGIFLIESLAHAFGNEKNGKLLGTFGDAAIFSFGRDKVISSIEGGGVAVKDQTLKTRLEGFQKTTHPLPFFRLFQDLLHPFITSVSARIYFMAFLGRILLTLAQRLHLINKVIDETEYQGDHPKSFLLPNCLAHIAVHQMKHVQTEKRHRREIAKVYQTHLQGDTLPLEALPRRMTGGDSGDVLLLQERDSLSFPRDECAYLRFPVLVYREKDALVNFLKKHHVFVGDWYFPVIAPKIPFERVQYIKGSCPKAELLSEQVINLPTHQKISKKDAENIAKLINFFSKSILPPLESG